MNSYLFTWKKTECEDPKGEVQNNTEKEGGGEKEGDIGNREQNKDWKNEKRRGKDGERRKTHGSGNKREV